MARSKSETTPPRVLRRQERARKRELRVSSSIRVFDGSLVNPYELKPVDMKPMTFLHSLSCLSRFHGHSSYPYSVGQHSRNLALLVPEDLQRVALIHDFSEALFNDLASPVKRQNPEYKAAEHEASLYISQHFGVSFEEHVLFDHYDKCIYINERDALFEGKVDELGFNDHLQPLDTTKVHGLFDETPWWKIRSDLRVLWNALFPEYDINTGKRIHG